MACGPGSFGSECQPFQGQVTCYRPSFPPQKQEWSAVSLRGTRRRFPHRTKCLRGSWRGSAIPDSQPTSRFGGDGVSVGCERLEAARAHGEAGGSRRPGRGRGGMGAGGFSGSGGSKVSLGSGAAEARACSCTGCWGALRGGQMVVLVEDALGPRFLRNTGPVQVLSASRFFLLLHSLPAKKLFRNIEKRVLALY